MNGERKGGDCRGELRGRRSGLPCRPAPWSDATAIIRLVSYGARAVEGGRGCGAICVRACLCRSVGRGARAGGATSALDRRCAAAALLSAWGVGVVAPLGASTIAGTKGGASVSSSAVRRASRRHVNNCCGVRPWRRATWQARTPSSKFSATIAAFGRRPSNYDRSLKPRARERAKSASAGGRRFAQESLDRGAAHDGLASGSRTSIPSNRAAAASLLSVVARGSAS